MGEEGLAGVPTLVYANKQDLLGAKTARVHVDESGLTAPPTHRPRSHRPTASRPTTHRPPTAPPRCTASGTPARSG